MYWLSYGGGVNSTALAILLCEGKLPALAPWEAIFADTGDEKDETYAFIDGQFKPYLAGHGKRLHVCRDKESVLERWERLGVVGSRVLRTCTSHAKSRPITAYIRARDEDPTQIIGIDAGESHRARPVLDETRDIAKLYPLVGLGVGRAQCRDIIRQAGLCVPVKSGCWHCPFLRKREVLDLARDHVERFARIIELEDQSLDLRPLDPGKVRAQWHERPARRWAAMAREESRQGRLMELGSDPDDAACGCYDG
jgi:3'-phosphoadenosine 5'-phosphosulfate sulfotransferase (PAPS reductase)/FAD synthetase